MQQLEGKVAVVTGGASGIGRALAEVALAEGMLVMIGDIDGPRARTVCGELAASGRVAWCEVDVSDARAVDALRDATLAEFGAVHLVCNNAGVSGRRHALAETTTADWDWVVGVNLLGVVHGVRSFLPLLVEQGEGHVVNTASLAGWTAVPFAAPYVATKHAVVGLSQSLALELASTAPSIGVTLLCPDWLRTEIADARRHWPDHLGEYPAESSDPGVQFVDTMLTDAVSQAPPPDAFARAAIDAVKAEQFVVFTETPLVEQALEGHRQVMQGAPPRVPM
jgi:NAD(P)-dependent dehydrogenase (short-subunit alcohol dehydrogenase family)